MKIVNIIGGLGNQMFQYAFYLSLCNNYPNEKIYIDLHHFAGYKLHNGFELDKIFRLNKLQIASVENIKHISRYIPNYFCSRIIRKLLPKRKSEFMDISCYCFNPDVFKVSHDCYFEGYWQSNLYFESIDDEIKKQFEFISIDDENEKLAIEMKNENSVCLHIRRGDYVDSRTFSGICELDYYERSINYMMSRYKLLKFYVFSNDIQWCKENLLPLFAFNKVVFVNHNMGQDSYKDMYLMSSCKNMIIANSSFSWWAAYLNRNINPLIIAPARWINNTTCTDIYKKDWVKL